ncbi:MAG: ATP-binding domain-containing protein [Myxococcales bacterium]|nr:ATP-binding domain-containing protein [Myxococcales bacterium]
MAHPIVAEEQELLEQVRTLLEEEPYDLPPSEADIVAELLRLREEMPGAKAEDLGALMEQYNRNHALLEQVRASRDRPQVDPDSPYFAHLRLTEGSRSRDVFLGKATRISRGIRIVDWRHAPISRLFYAYQQGDEYEEELGGKTHIGEVVARRTVTIRRRELERIDAPEGTFAADPEAPEGWRCERAEPARLAGGQGASMRSHEAGEALTRRLGTDLAGARKRRDKRLPDIAGLIDADQFELITRPSSGFVVIRGTAGSGKTTVALHRIAYLAYSDPEINSKRTLFVVFSPALREYVSHVLPALGVDRAQVRDFRGWASSERRRHFPQLPRTHRDDTPADVVRLKLHPVMLQVLEDQVATVAGPSTAEQAFDDVVSVLSKPESISRALRDAGSTAFTDAELTRICDWCRDRFDEVVAWWDDKEVEADLDEEDDALLLRAYQLRVGPLKRKGGGRMRFRHVAIDEVQDFSPLEVRVLIGCLDRSESITLAGDTQQHVMKDAGFTSWAEFFGHLGLEGTAVSTLRIAYRSSAEIVTFARRLLGELSEDDDPPLVTRSGPPVEMFRFTDHGACVAFLADALKDLIQAEPLASVALLTPSADVSRLYHAGLQRSEVPRVRRVTSQDFTFAPGIEITEVASVKGLEFDYIVIVEADAASYPDTPSARRLLHVGATRAVHQLWVTAVGTPSAILRQAMGEE